MQLRTHLDCRDLILMLDLILAVEMSTIVKQLLKQSFKALISGFNWGLHRAITCRRGATRNGTVLHAFSRGVKEFKKRLNCEPCRSPHIRIPYWSWSANSQPTHHLDVWVCMRVLCWHNTVPARNLRGKLVSPGRPPHAASRSWPRFLQRR